MSRIGVLVPVGCKTAQAVLLHPIGRDTDARGVKLRTGQRSQSKPCPIPQKNGHQSNYLRPHTPPGQKPQEGIAQTNLGERVLEGEIRLRRMRRPQRDTQRRQGQSPPHRVEEHPQEALIRLLARSDGPRQGQTHQERKGRLDQVMERAPLPIHMILMVREKMPHTVGGHVSGHGSETNHFASHQQHHEPAVGIHRRQSLRHRWGFPRTG